MVTADEELDRFIIDEARRYFQLTDQDTEIEIRKNRLISEPGKFDSILIEPLTRGEPRGIISVQVSLFDDNRLIERGHVRLRISYFDSVLVAAHLIRRHDYLNSDNVIRQRREVTYQTEPALNKYDEIENKWVKRNINQDQIITADLIEPVPLIKRYSMVDIIYNGPAFEISVVGKAFEAGSRGDIIRVQNSQSKKIIAATVIDDKTVEVLSR
jgi:flagella basal body P-ring formation protein FlgA